MIEWIASRLPSEDLLGRRADLRGGPVSLSYDLKATGDVRRATESSDVARSRLYGYDEEQRITRPAITGLPFCETRSPRELARLDAEWKAVAREAKRLVRDAPSLSAADAHNRLLTVLEQLRTWMEKYSVPTPSLLGVLAGTQRGGVDFATTMSAYLARRASGVDFGQEDLDLLETLVGLAERANVRQAVENDPTWRYTHDANGAVTSMTVEIPSFVLVPADPGGPSQTPAVVSPVIYNTMCYRYDARQRMVQVETVVRIGAQVSSTTPPCEDAARATMASFRYDEANRRVYANVAGKETWELRGASGELLAEVSKAGEVERAYVYLDGEPLAVVALRPGKALRSPTTPLGCASSGGGLSGSLAALVLLAVLLRRRNGRGALAALALMLVGCDGRGPEVEPPPAPGIGQLEGDIFYFHNDRLGTPVRLTNEQGRTVWRADYRPFGDVERLETDVDGDLVHIEQPLRFPGQYEDALSGLILAQGPYYNWNRHYEPATGRYFSGEPLLQHADQMRKMAQEGIPVPTFAYARGNPVAYMDPGGRQAVLPPPEPANKTSGDPGKGCSSDWMEGNRRDVCNPPPCPAIRYSVDSATLSPGFSIQKALTLCAVKSGRGEPRYVIYSYDFSAATTVDCFYCDPANPKPKDVSCPPGAQ